MVEANQFVYSDSRERCLAGYVLFSFVRPSGVQCCRIHLFSWVISYYLPLIPRSDADNHRLSASVIGLYTSYATPIFLRITSGRDKFVPGRFTLGRWIVPIGAIAVAWVTFINIVLMFPTVQPTTASNMSESYTEFPSPIRNPCHPDYAVVIIMVVFIYAALSWVLSARKWFTGPIRNLSQAPSLEEKDL